VRAPCGRLGCTITLPIGRRHWPRELSFWLLVRSPSCPFSLHHPGRTGRRPEPSEASLPLAPAPAHPGPGSPSLQGAQRSSQGHQLAAKGALPSGSANPGVYPECITPGLGGCTLGRPCGLPPPRSWCSSHLRCSTTSCLCPWPLLRQGPRGKGRGTRWRGHPIAAPMPAPALLPTPVPVSAPVPVLMLVLVRVLGRWGVMVVELAVGLLRGPCQGSRCPLSGPRVHPTPPGQGQGQGRGEGGLKGTAGEARFTDGHTSSSLAFRLGVRYSLGPSPRPSARANTATHQQHRHSEQRTGHQPEHWWGPTEGLKRGQ